MIVGVLLTITITIFIITNMARCSKCNINLACGCQLINGMCAACNAAVKQATNRIKNAITKAYQLF